MGSNMQAVGEGSGDVSAELFRLGKGPVDNSEMIGLGRTMVLFGGAMVDINVQGWESGEGSRESTRER